ncbi:MAG: glycosyltransferase family 4 protein [Tannerella sp.]|jgi:glycosyltransferase involved in cell wall biosynthesis|nr:glycosyltransferase family 4 protein [Tannerella sp.]
MAIPEKKIKIVVTGTRGIPNILGGVETHCEELFPRMAERGYDVTVIRRKNYVKDQLVSYKGVSLFDIPNNKKKSFEAILHTFRAIWAAKRKFRTDIVHIHAVGPAILTPFARLLGMKVVFTHHGPDYDREKWGKAAKFMLRFGERMGCTFANEVIVISNVINDIIKQKYGRKDAHLIYNGVSAPIIADNTTYLNELGIEAHKYIFAMGRFVPEKNFHLLIKAFLSLNQSGYKLVIAGDADIEDDYSRNLKSSANKNGIVLTGFIKGVKLQTLLSYAGLFVIPSSHEGLPISLLEAMSYGLPVLASDIPANKEVNLPSSCYFRYNDPANTNLSEALVRKMNDKRKPSYDLSPYNWDKIAEQTAEVYRKTIKNIP